MDEYHDLECLESLEFSPPLHEQFTTMATAIQQIADNQKEMTQLLHDQQKKLNEIAQSVSAPSTPAQSVSTWSTPAQPNLVAASSLTISIAIAALAQGRDM